MKIIYVNINNSSVFYNDKTEVVFGGLDNDFFFHLGKKIAGNCSVKREISLVRDFNSVETKKDYQQIVLQWNEIKRILFREKRDCKFDFVLPEKYIQWLKYNDNEEYKLIYDNNFLGKESFVVSIDMDDLYEDTVAYLQCKILRTLKKNNLYQQVNEIVFNEDIVTQNSPIVHAIIGKYKQIQFSSFNDYKRKYSIGCKERNEKVLKNEQKQLKSSDGLQDESSRNTKSAISEDGENKVEVYIVNWLCDEFLKEKGWDWRDDKIIMNNLFVNAKKALEYYKQNGYAEISVPYVAKSDVNGNPIHRTHFKRILTEHIYKMILMESVERAIVIPDVLDEKMVYLWRLKSGLIVCREEYKYGLIGEEGVTVLPCEYDEIEELGSGNIRIRKNGKYGVFNNEKNLNLPCKYDELYDVENGLFKVKIENRYYKIDDCNGVIIYKYENDEWRSVNIAESVFVYEKMLLTD